MTKPQSRITHMLTNKVALVTGGGTGIGKAIAQSLARSGARVAITSRSRAHLEPAAHIMTAEHLAVMPIEMDIRKKTDIERAVKEVVSTWGAVHILVNNAGISGLSLIDDADDSKWFDILDTNLNGMYLITKSALRH